MNYISLSLTIVAIVNAALGLLLVLTGQKHRTSRVYAINIVMILSWIFGMFFYRLSAPDTIVIWTKFLYVSATLIASSFLYFTYIFPIHEEGFTRKKKVLIIIPNILLGLLIIFGDHIILNSTVRAVGENHIAFGDLYILYVLYILSYFLYGFFRLFIKYSKSADLFEKRQAIYLLTGYSLSANIAFVTNLILPWFGYFELNWVGQVSTITMVTFATYAIVKHQLFNIKAIAAEFFIGSLWIFLLIRTVLSENYQERIINGALLMITIIVGIFLIRSIVTEVRTREKVERLAADLEQANERLKDLDQQKSEFVSLASHQLRGPLTAIKGYASMLLDGDFGEVKDGVKEATEKIYKSTQDLVILVGDYLNVSRIEQGRMEYDFTIFDLQKLVATVVSDLRPTIEGAHLSIDFDYNPSESYMVNADIGKIKQVIGNLIDNSIKYTPHGGIHVWLARNASKKVLITISDTGVGIKPEVLPRLFEKFTRAPDASRTNIMGTGLGLYVAKKMVEAHNGRVWAESAGQGKGASFFIELSAVN